LQSYAATEFPVSELEVTEAQNKLQAARDELETIEHETQAKRGALQQVGGDVYKQGAAEAEAQLQTAKQRERESDLDFNAWELLRQTLREAEQEEGSHLGPLVVWPDRIAFFPIDRRPVQQTRARAWSRIPGHLCCR